MAEATMSSDALRDYVESGSAESFRRVVEGHIDAVFSQCRRQLRDADRAQEATQMVFVILARKARELPKGVLLGGWLFKTARYVCARERRTEGRRLARERRAAEMRREMTGEHSTGSANVKSEAEDLLDDALAKLSERDRTVILCRFFEERSLRDVGLAMGISEDAAKQRVLRAVEKLRAYFARQGLAVPSAVVTASLSGAVRPATPGLLDAVVSAATKGAVPMHPGIFKSMAGGTLIKGAAAALAIGGMVAVSIVAAKQEPAMNPVVAAPIPAAPVSAAAPGNGAATMPSSDTLNQATPVNALRKLAQAIREDNVDDIDACVSFTDRANPGNGDALRATMVCNGATCRADQAWLIAFGQKMKVEGFGFDIFPGLQGGFEELIDKALDGLKAGDVTITEDTATVRVRITNGQMPRYGQAAWSDASLIMRREGNQWRLDAPASVTLEIHYEPKQADSSRVFIQSGAELSRIMHKAADAIEAGELKTPKQASDQIRTEFWDVLHGFQLTNATINTLPKSPNR